MDFSRWARTNSCLCAANAYSARQAETPPHLHKQNPLRRPPRLLFGSTPTTRLTKSTTTKGCGFTRYHTERVRARGARA
eukprot:15471126-Alexandrium_andersonii.AAC.1